MPEAGFPKASVTLNSVARAHIGKVYAKMNVKNLIKLSPHYSYYLSYFIITSYNDKKTANEQC